MAGFQHVPPPLPFVNRLGRTIYYLFFASQKPVGQRTVEDIFAKYRAKQGL